MISFLIFVTLVKFRKYINQIMFLRAYEYLNFSFKNWYISIVVFSSADAIYYSSHLIFPRTFKTLRRFIKHSAFELGFSLKFIVCIVNLLTNLHKITPLLKLKSSLKPSCLIQGISTEKNDYFLLFWTDSLWGGFENELLAIVVSIL